MEIHPALMATYKHPQLCIDLGAAKCGHVKVSGLRICRPRAYFSWLRGTAAPMPNALLNEAENQEIITNDKVIFVCSIKCRAEMWYSFTLHRRVSKMM